jgi:nucleotide-binding universal stress UspA family protein
MTNTDTRPETERRRVAGPRASRGRPIATTRVRAPVVAAVESTTARATAEVAAQLAHELKAPLTFIHVRPHPPAIGGRARSQRRSVRALFRGHSALDAALSVATRWGVMAHGEILDGNPVDELVEVATRRKARLLVVGSRRRRLRRSLSRRVFEASGVPVVVAHAHPR